ncbi:collagen alpha-1(XII) chain [Aplysia californica]|uniref:Collagen alpha-1(XII) chain n=1 Tax=Aplysia californica TaxID=6500 RepID=A0ABM0JNQ7_APLCA|nr:collagen alpha-1(XII) chain [Aplysia californica]
MMKAGLVLCFLAALSGAQGVNISCSQPADIFFLLDDSRSIWTVYFKNMITFVKELVGQFDISTTSTRIAASTFSEGNKPQFQFGDYNTLAEVNHAFDTIHQSNGGSTQTHIGLEFAKNSISQKGRPGVPHILIVITDGASSNRSETVKAANATRSEGTEIMVIGVGSLDRTQLEEIASKPVSDHVFTVRQFPQLSSIGSLVGQKACPDLGPTDMPMDQAVAEKECQQKPAEVVFALDKSSSIYILDFKKQLTFVSDLIKMFDIGKDKTRVAIVSFSTNASVEFHLDEYYLKKDVTDRTEKILYTGGNTNTGAALKLVNGSVLTSEHGVRSNVPHVVIVITDGRSQKYLDTQAQAKALKNSGAFVFAIGVGSSVYDQELKDIASAPSDQFVFETTGYDALPSIKNILAFRACEQTSQASGRR